MHELAVTRSLLNQVLAEAKKEPGRHVVRINLLVGREAGVVPGCVQFYFDRMKAGTAAETATLEFRTVPLVLRCPKCGREFSELTDICSCNAGAEVVSGQELVVESLELEGGTAAGPVS